MSEAYPGFQIWGVNCSLVFFSSLPSRRFPPYPSPYFLGLSNHFSIPQPCSENIYSTPAKRSGERFELRQPTCAFWVENYCPVVALLQSFSDNRWRYFAGSVSKSTFDADVHNVIEVSDNDLFNKVLNRIHCLSSLLPPSNPANYVFNLRPRGHDLSLPSVKKVLVKNSFITRALFKYK